MARRTKNLTDIEGAGWSLSDDMRAYVAEKYPTFDADGTAEIFIDKALAGDWVYKNWDAAFRNYLRNAGNYGGVAYRDNMQDPRWHTLILEAQSKGFRRPRMPLETIEQYRKALRAFQPRQAELSAVDEMGGACKAMADAARTMAAKLRTSEARQVKIARDKTQMAERWQK